jgi:glycosyltransferase involved in cell wall biosynthesis
MRHHLSANADSASLVYLIINRLVIGGAEKQLLILARHLDRQAFQPHIIAFEDGPLRREIEQMGIPLTVLNIPTPLIDQWRNPRTGWNLLRIVGQLALLFRRSRPQIVHGYLLAANLCSVLSGRLAGVPAIVVSRRNLGDLKRVKSARWFESLVSKLAMAVVCNSEGIRQDILQHEVIRSDKLHLIYNGIEPFPVQMQEGTTLRQELGLLPATPLIGYVANLHPIKGHVDLLHAFARLRTHLPEARLVLVGGDRGIAPDLIHLTSELKLQDAVHFLGLRNDVGRILAALDLQVHCSHSEGLSNAILEGCLLARPLVVTAVGGNTEIISDGVTGLVVPPRDPERLAGAMLALLSDPTRSKQLGAAAQRYVAETFSTEAMVAATERLYRSLTRGGVGYSPGEPHSCPPEPIMERPIQ